MTPESATLSKFWLRAFALGMAALAPYAGTVRADVIAGIYQRLQADPRNVALNLEYARAAEKAGKLKWALPAYERALSADHENLEARQGIERITGKLRAEAEKP